VLFRLGKLVALAETAAIFAERVSSKPTKAIGLEIETRQALARIYARDTALKIAAEGLQWSIGAGQADPNLASSLNLSGIYQAQAGLIEDMDFAAKKLIATFPA
jgi:hypothetical protein